MRSYATVLINHLFPTELPETRQCLIDQLSGRRVSKKKLLGNEVPRVPGGFPPIDISLVPFTCEMYERELCRTGTPCTKLSVCFALIDDSSSMLTLGYLWFVMGGGSLWNCLIKEQLAEALKFLDPDSRKSFDSLVEELEKRRVAAILRKAAHDDEAPLKKEGGMGMDQHTGVG